MPDYSNGKIYTIRCKTNPLHVYVGSTVNTLSRRLQYHKSYSIHRKNVLLYSTIANNWNDWFIELYEYFPCDNRKQLCKREGEIIRLIGTLNSRTRSRSDTNTKEAFSVTMARSSLSLPMLTISECMTPRPEISRP